MTKTEVGKYLADRNVVVGAEFEIICPSYKELADKAFRSEAFLMDMNFEYEIYMNRLTEYLDGDRYTCPSVPKWARKMGYKKGDEIPDPMALKQYRRRRGGITKRVLKDMVENYFRIDLLPIEDYMISTNISTKNIDRWIVKPDYSLPFHGFELVSPPMPVKRFMGLLPAVFKHIDKYSDTNSQCGFHVNISLKNVSNLRQDLDILTLIAEVDENYIYDYFKSRRRCEYAIPTRGKLRCGDSRLDHYSHMDAVNLSHLCSRNNKYVEFRHLGGRGYHTRFTVIKKIIAMYIKAMKRASGKEK